MERRRGEALKDAILGAAWAELSQVGYSSFTLDGVSKRAETSRTVLARRWQSRADLAASAIAHYLQHNPVKIPDLGNLRDDLIALLERTSHRSYAINGIVFSMRDYFTDTGSSLSELRGRLAPDPIGGDAMTIILQRGIERGEIDPTKLTKRIASLPIDLVRHETLMTNRPASKALITEIVETVFLPLARPDRPLRVRGRKSTSLRTAAATV